ncbi:hypothetical protein, partial [Acinetobacter baumannii]
LTLCIDLMSSVWICKLFLRYSKVSVIKLNLSALEILQPKFMVMAIMSHFIKVALSTCPIKTVCNSMQAMETNWHI